MGRKSFNYTKIKKGIYQNLKKDGEKGEGATFSYYHLESDKTHVEASAKNKSQQQQLKRKNKQHINRQKRTNKRKKTKFGHSCDKVLV